MEKIEEYITFFNERLIKREVSEDIKQLIKTEDIFLLSQIGLPNCEDFSFDFSIDFSFSNGNIQIGSRCDLPILYDIKNHNIFTIYEAERKFYASCLLDFLGVMYAYEKNLLNMINGKFGSFYQNKKLYRDNFIKDLLEINKDFQDIEEYIGWHIGAYLQELE